jgi:hypothetical protein
MTEHPPEPWNDHSNARHEQLFGPLKPEAGVACPLIKLDPRHAFVPNLYFQHGALLARTRPIAVEGASCFIYPARAVVTCDRVHTLSFFWRAAHPRDNPAYHQ